MNNYVCNFNVIHYSISTYIFSISLTFSKLFKFIYRDLMKA